MVTIDFSEFGRRVSGPREERLSLPIPYQQWTEEYILARQGLQAYTSGTPILSKDPFLTAQGFRYHIEQQFITSRNHSIGQKRIERYSDSVLKMVEFWAQYAERNWGARRFQTTVQIRIRRGETRTFTTWSRPSIFRVVWSVTEDPKDSLAGQLRRLQSLHIEYPRAVSRSRPFSLETVSLVFWSSRDL